MQAVNFPVRFTLRKSAPRCGFTLVEMLIAIVLTGLLLGIAVTTLASLQRYHQQTHHRSIERAEIHRLTDVLRRDMRQAADVHNTDETTLVVLRPDGSQIHYSLHGDSCQRSLKEDVGGKERRDSFATGPVVRWRIDPPPDSRSITSVWLERASGDDDKSVSPAAHIIAAPRTASDLKWVSETQ